VYRGQGLPGLRGVYVFADYCGGKVWGLVQRGDGFGLAELLSTGLAVSSFGEDARGELYLTDRGGGVYRFTDG
jgi:hypothetical protein